MRLSNYIPLILMILAIDPVYGQYRTNHAKDILRERFFKGDFWLMPTDTTNVCFFRSKKDARKTAQIKVVPVYKPIGLEVPLKLEADYSIYVGLLYKHDSYLNTFNVWTNQSSGKDELEIVLVEDPPPGFLHYAAKNKVGYVLADNAFLIFEAGIPKVWDGVTYVSYQPNKMAHERRYKLMQEKLPQLTKTTEYSLKKTKHDNGWAGELKNMESVVIINPAEHIPDTELNRIRIIFKGESYSLEYGGYRFIYDVDRRLLVGYSVDDGNINDEKHPELDFKIVKNKRGLGFKLIDSLTGKILVNVPDMKTEPLDHLTIQIDTDRYSDLLELTAIMLFWEELIK